jgi:hypothetical protein
MSPTAPLVNQMLVGTMGWSIIEQLDNKEGDETVNGLADTQVRDRTGTIVPEKDQPLEVRRENARWIGPSNDERLTLVTCWPRHDNTHRLILVALPAP